METMGGGATKDTFAGSSVAGPSPTGPTSKAPPGYTPRSPLVLSGQRSLVSKHTVEQVHLRHRGRVFHFVSYEGRAEDRQKNRAATDPSWFLMDSGTRGGV